MRWSVDSGKIYIGGDDVTKLSEYKRAKYLGRVFQDPMTGTASGDHSADGFHSEAEASVIR